MSIDRDRFIDVCLTMMGLHGSSLHTHAYLPRLVVVSDPNQPDLRYYIKETPTAFAVYKPSEEKGVRPIYVLIYNKELQKCMGWIPDYAEVVMRMMEKKLALELLSDV